MVPIPMTSFFRPAFAAVVFALWSLALFSPAQAVETMAKHAILIDTSTGTILMEKDADTATAPASLSKIMMLYLIFERLAEGNLTMEDTFAVSEKAWRMGGSKMFVGVNTRVTIADLLRGVIVQSGNDASIVIAEGLGGTESNFAVEMTERAFELGLTNSVFKNATGWPEEGHVMSARDIATLAFRLITDFPQYYPIFEKPVSPITRSGNPIGTPCCTTFPAPMA